MFDILTYNSYFGNINFLDDNDEFSVSLDLDEVGDKTMLNFHDTKSIVLYIALDINYAKKIITSKELESSMILYEYKEVAQANLKNNFSLLQNR